MVALTVLGSVVAAVVSYYLWTYLSSPLKSFPSAHWSSSFSNLWRLINVWGRKSQWTHIRLHEKYGSAVRMGPNIVSVSDPNALKEVFRSRNPWKKTPFYSVNDVMVQGHRVSNVFGTLDEDWHTKVMKPIKGLYSMTRALDMEPHIDTTIREFYGAIEKRFVEGQNAGKAFDAGDWVPFFAWDSMSRQTFGRPYGMLESGADTGGLIDTSTKALHYFAAISQIPNLDLWLDKNPVRRVGPPSFMWATIQAFGAVAQRKEEPTGEAYNRQSDYLDKFLQAKEQYPDTVDDNMVVNYLLVNLLAGSDTTSAYVCSAIYHVLKTPHALKRIQAEFDAAGLSREGVVSWNEIQRLPYFRAVMQEAERVSPGIGLMLERFVPPEGFTLPDGRFLPGGTIVGCNPWVINHLESVYGKDPHSFVPERWLQQDGEATNAFDDRVKRMSNTDMAFGAGKRKCLGMNIGILTANKLVASLFNRYDVALKDPKKEWTVDNSWFIYHHGIDVTVRLREGREVNGHANGSV